jgi:hypothetical protein
MILSLCPTYILLNSHGAQYGPLSSMGILTVDVFPYMYMTSLNGMFGEMPADFAGGSFLIWQHGCAC